MNQILELVRFVTDRFAKGMGLFGVSFFYLVIIMFLLRLNPPLAFLSLVAFGLIEVLSGFIKIAFHKHRPEPTNNRTMLEKYESGSFPSIHSARAACLVVLMWVLFLDPVLLVVSILIALSVGYSRVARKRHFVSDVIGGFVLGGLVGALVLL